VVQGIGPEKSPGTAIFALTGKINNTGLIEVPMGISLGEIIFDVGGGIPDGQAFKAVQTGGPLGGCLPARRSTPGRLRFITAAGATMGSGGMIVVDDDTCMVEFAKYFLEFATAESCGKCVPCRVGGMRLLEVLTRISEGQGTRQDVEEIKYISANMQSASLCSLGQLTPGPVMSALRFFMDEFTEHVDNQNCPAGQCKALVRGEVHQRVSGRGGKPCLPGAHRAGPLRRASPSTASATRSPLSAAACARLSASRSAAAARSTSRSASGWSSASWLTTSSAHRGRRQGGEAEKPLKVGVVGAGPAA
jgi:hypothetical protein